MRLLYECADCCADAYEYAYTYDHQQESLHTSDLLRFGITADHLLYECADCCADAYEYAYAYDHQQESLHTSDLLCHKFMLYCSFCVVMFLVALLSQTDGRLSIAFLKFSEK